MNLITVTWAYGKYIVRCDDMNIEGSFENLGDATEFAAALAKQLS